MQCVVFEGAIDLNVAKHEVLEIRGAFEWDACPLPHRTVSSIAPGEVAHSNHFLHPSGIAEETAHAVLLRHVVEQFDGAFDHHSDRREVIAEYGLGLGLRDEQNEWEAGVRLAEVAQPCFGGASDAEMNEETSADIAAADQHLSESEALEYFQAASLYCERTRFVDPVHCAVDHPELHAKAGQSGSERQPGRAGTHNQRIQHVGSARPAVLRTYCGV
jgi:hypothetical protein